jgi:hypothetical protein
MNYSGFERCCDGNGSTHRAIRVKRVAPLGTDNMGACACQLPKPLIILPGIKFRDRTMLGTRLQRTVVPRRRSLAIIDKALAHLFGCFAAI